jgi:hypothetical protein
MEMPFDDIHDEVARLKSAARSGELTNREQGKSRVGTIVDVDDFSLHLAVEPGTCDGMSDRAVAIFAETLQVLGQELEEAEAAIYEHRDEMRQRDRCIDEMRREMNKLRTHILDMDRMITFQLHAFIQRRKLDLILDSEVE